VHVFFGKYNRILQPEKWGHELDFEWVETKVDQLVVN